MAASAQTSVSIRPTLFKLAVENLNIRKRSDADKGSMRTTLKTLIEAALENAIPEAAKGCACRDTEDGIEMVIPSRVAKSDVLSQFLPEFELGMAEYNNHCTPSAVCRLRAVLHLADDDSTRNGADTATRLVASSFLRLFLMALPKNKCLALLVSDEYYRQMLAAPQATTNRDFRRTRIRTVGRIPLTVWAYHYPYPDAR